MELLACASLLVAVYLLVVHWTLYLQGSSLGPLLVGSVACLAAWPAIGPLALLAFVLDPGSLLYGVLSARWLWSDA
jgi:hypothetical protein